MTMTPEQRAEILAAQRAASQEWRKLYPGDKQGANRAAARAAGRIRYKYDPRRKARSITKATVYLPCSCARVGGLWLGGDGQQPGEVVWRECPGWRTTRFEWASGHTSWVHRVAAKEFLMGRQLYLRPRAATVDGWSTVTPSDPEPLDPRAVLGALGLANDPESFARRVLVAARSINSDAARLPIQRADRAAIAWAREQLADGGDPGVGNCP